MNNKIKVSTDIINFVQSFHGIFEKDHGYHYGVFNWFKVDEENNIIEFIDDKKTNERLSNYFKDDVNYVGLNTPFQIQILSERLNEK